MRRIRLGVLGLGAVAQAVHLPLIARRPDLFELVSVCDLAPEVLNALDAEASASLERIWQRIETDRAVRAVVLSGTGERAFCAGADPVEVAQEDLRALPEQPLFDRDRSGRDDDLAELLGEEYVRAVTSGEEQGVELRDEPVDEEAGGPFVETWANAMAERGILFIYGSLSNQPTPYPHWAAAFGSLSLRGWVASCSAAGSFCCLCGWSRHLPGK